VPRVNERIGVRELRQHASRYLDRVKAGATVEITERGRLIATLTPPTAPSAERERLMGAGLLIAARRPFAPPAPTQVPSRPTEDALTDLRGERL
jgi:prevent-host-death family protein